MRTTSTSFTLSITGVGFIVDPIIAGVGCATAKFDEICSSWWKKKERNYFKKYGCIRKTIDDFRNLYTKSLKDN